MVKQSILIQSLDLETNWICEILQKDIHLNNSYKICVKAIKIKYRGSPLKYKLKLEATKNQFIDFFLVKFLENKKKNISKITESITSYFKTIDKYKTKYKDQWYFYWKYIEHKGANRFFGFGKKFYLEHKTPPYEIINIS